MKSERQLVNVLGNPIDVLGWEEALARMSDWSANHESRYVCICNVHSVVTAKQNAEFGRVVKEADMATPDGAPVAWMLRHYGHAKQQRINGPDLMWRYCELAQHRNESMFLFGGTSETLAALKSTLQTAFPGLQIAGEFSPPFRAITPEEDAAIVEQINASGASVVWVSLGCPKQELWMAEHRGRINAVMVGVGAAFSYHTGALRRAPLWMRDYGMEWLHRLAAEPKRLWKRYLVTNTLFVFWAITQLIRTSKYFGGPRTISSSEQMGQRTQKKVEKLRILIHGINFSPELTGIGKYTGEMTDWLATHGYEVRVVTAPPYYPQWKVADGYSRWWTKEQIEASTKSNPKLSAPHDACESINSPVVYRCPLWVPAKPSGLKRVVHLASFALSSFPIMLSQIFWRPHIVLVVEPALFCAPQAWLVARLCGGKAWLHIQDFEMDAAFNLGMLKGVGLRRFVSMGERWLMRRFDRISTISSRMVERAVSKGVALERVVLFRNWVDTKGLNVADLEFTNSGMRGYRTELGITSDKVVALYSGNMGGKQGLDVLAQSAKLLNEEKNIVFVFCGDGAGRDGLVTMCEGMTNVYFLDLQPAERLSELLSMADIHLLPQRADAADLVMPSKLTGILMSGRPVIATAYEDTELASVVENCGLVVEPEQPDALAEVILQLASDVALRDRLGAAGRVYAEANLDKEDVLGGFQIELNKLRAEK